MTKHELQEGITRARENVASWPEWKRREMDKVWSSLPPAPNVPVDDYVPSEENGGDRSV